MKLIDWLLVSSLFVLAGLVTTLHLVPHGAQPQPAESVGAIFYDGNFGCSGSVMADKGNRYFVTARHCVIDQHFVRRPGKLTVSFSANEAGPFYSAKLVALGLDDDVALLQLTNDEAIPALSLGDEHDEQLGDPIYNISFPLDAGKVRFDGHFMLPQFAHFSRFLEELPEWRKTMPMQLTIAHGSSGSPVFNARGQVIGIAVGTFGEGDFNIAVPVSRVQLILREHATLTWDLFTKVHPPTEDDDEIF